jgi:hypothetical protein
MHGGGPAHSEQNESPSTALFQQFLKLPEVDRVAARRCPTSKPPVCGVSQIAASDRRLLDRPTCMNQQGKLDSDTHGVSLSSELPLKSRLEFVGSATPCVGAPFVKVLCCLRLENAKSLAE